MGKDWATQGKGGWKVPAGSSVPHWRLPEAIVPRSGRTHKHRHYEGHQQDAPGSGGAAPVIDEGALAPSRSLLDPLGPSREDRPPPGPIWQQSSGSEELGHDVVCGIVYVVV